MPKPRTPRPFSLHFGDGLIAEEATFEGAHHVPALQLLEFTDGQAAGTVSIRFCYFNKTGQFQRSPLLLDEEGIDGLREALELTPRLRALLQRLVAD